MRAYDLTIDDYVEINYGADDPHYPSISGIREACEEYLVSLGYPREALIVPRLLVAIAEGASPETVRNSQAVAASVALAQAIR
jgi:hypothetical protein